LQQNRPCVGSFKSCGTATELNNPFSFYRELVDRRDLVVWSNRSNWSIRKQFSR